MPDYSRKTETELEDIYLEGSNLSRAEAEEELMRRGIEQDDDGYFEFESEYQEPKDKSINYDEVKFGPIVLGILGIAVLLVGLFCTHFILGYSTNYTTEIWVGFGISLVLMILTRGRSKFFNFIFYLGCFAFLTRLFVNIIEYSEDQSYMSFLFVDETTDMIDLIKYGFLYAVYIFFAPYLLMKYGTSYVRMLRKPKTNKNSSLNL